MEIRDQINGLSRIRASIRKEMHRLSLQSHDADADDAIADCAAEIQIVEYAISSLTALASYKEASNALRGL